jgi:hypothetical protein
MLAVEYGAAKCVEDGIIPIVQLPKLKHAIDLYKSLTANPQTITDLDNQWYYGPPATGKSTYARAEYPTLFSKGLHKWWCSYDGQDTVLLDDFDHTNTCLSGYLKRWADRFPFTAESKGGS